MLPQVSFLLTEPNIIGKGKKEENKDLYLHSTTDWRIPSGDYSCRETRVAADPVACESSILEYSTFYLEAYSSISGSFSSTSLTTVVSPGNVVFAEAVVVRRGADDPTWSGISTAGSTASSTASLPSSSAANSTTSPGAGESGNSSTESTGTSTSSPAPVGLSSSARAGIGIGVALGALVILSAIVGAFAIMKRKRRRAYLDKVERLPSRRYGGNPYEKPQELMDTGLHELPGRVGSRYELHGQGRRAEMHTDSLPVELMDHNSHGNE